MNTAQSNSAPQEDAPASDSNNAETQPPPMVAIIVHDGGEVVP